MTTTTFSTTSGGDVQRSVRFQFRKSPLPPIEDIVAETRRIYAYDPDAKGLIWRGHKNPKRPWPPIGAVVGGDDGHGYRMCLVLGHKFKVHQVVWIMHYGEFPAKAIDHINGDRRDNRLENLRLADDQQNSQNMKTAKRSMEGVKKDKHSPKYRAVVQHCGRKIHLGSFDTPEAANAAYIEGKRRICGEFSPV
jgi:hypothetical protein